MVKKKILYLMHVDWKWIYQRPHVIAKGLEEDYDVTVAYQLNYRQQRGMQKYNPLPDKAVRIYNIPYEGKNIFIYLLNKVWLKWYHHKFKKEKYDIIWFTSPVMLKYVDKQCSGIKIYDCMDDEVAMRMEMQKHSLTDRLVLKNEYVRNKKRLLEEAEYVLFSSQYLYSKFKTRCKGEPALVRNGYQQRDIHYEWKERKRIRRQLSIGYVGTIERWMDISLLQKSVLDYPNICYHLIGPCAVPIEETDNIILEGVVEHQQLYYKIAEYDCLIMPFIVNDIILAVDPVKLYEYISYGKCIISVYYPEIERFSDYIYFYRNEQEYMNLLEELVQSGFRPKYSKQQQEQFLYENTWEKRLQTIKCLIEECERNKDEQD